MNKFLIKDILDLKYIMSNNNKTKKNKKKTAY